MSAPILLIEDMSLTLWRSFEPVFFLGDSVQPS